MKVQFFSSGLSKNYFLSKGYESQIEILRKEKINIKRDLESKIESIKTDKESLSNSVLESRESRRQVDVLQKEVHEKNTIIERLQIIKNTIESERNTFRKEVNTLRTQINTLKDQERISRDELQVKIIKLYFLVYKGTVYSSMHVREESAFQRDGY